MAVTIGSAPDAGFDEPLRLLADCHRRIEMFLGVLERLAAEPGAVLLPDRRRALQAALTYFDEAAPRHTEDEERSLFPRMRERGAPELREALAALDALEADHERAESLHQEVERIGRNWLRFGLLGAGDGATLRGLVADLRGLYARHIEVEERVVFAAAGRTLEPGELEEIGREMADRRGVAWKA